MGRSGKNPASNLTAACRRMGTGVAAGFLLLAAACGGPGETEGLVPATTADRPAPQTTADDEPPPVISTTVAASTTTAPPPMTAPTTTAPPPTTVPTTTATTIAPPSGTIIELEVTDGRLEGGARREAAPLGEEVTVRVSGNSADHVHIHGYDLFLHLEDGEGELAFTADIPGVFEIELEEAGIVLVQLEVS